MNTMSTFTYLLNLEKSLDPGMESKIKKIEEKKKKLLAKTLIDQEIFQKGLCDFGRTYDNYNHAYLSLNVQNQELISIGGIATYKYLQNVDVSHNELTTLEQLGGLYHLTKLIANHNKLEEILDFIPPQNLEEIDYSFNIVKCIQNVDKNPYLKIINLSNNNITVINGLNTCTYLEELDLSYNQISVIENLENLGPSLLKLNLMGNFIKNITGLDNLVYLIELNLRKNSISRLKGLQNLQRLRYLYLSSNCLSRCNQVAYLGDLEYLTDLDFCYNEVQTKKFYRQQIIYYLPNLRLLDGEEVSPYEKVKADILFGSDLEDKKRIFETYLPEEKFVDRRLFVREQIDPESDSEEEILERDKGTTGGGATLSSLDRRTKGGDMFESGMGMSTMSQQARDYKTC